MITEDMKLAVKQGANWLDDCHPDWVLNIDLSILMMNSCEYCVIGQAVGDYYEVISLQGSKNDTDEYHWALDHGFQAPNFYSSPYEDDNAAKQEFEYYAGLELLWGEEVKKRLE